MEYNTPSDEIFNDIKVESDRQELIKQITAFGVQLGYDMDFINKKIAGIKNMAEAHQILSSWKELGKTESDKPKVAPF
jgi:hypothetical protein